MSQSTRADTFKTSMKIETAVAECHLLTRVVLQVPPVEKDQQGYDNTLFPTYDPIVPPPPPEYLPFRQGEIQPDLTCDQFKNA